MNHRASPDFWEAYRQLPVAVQKAADAAFELLVANPRHPSLRLKKVNTFWSARVGLAYRAIAVEASDGLVWFWIGTHAAYDKLM